MKKFLRNIVLACMIVFFAVALSGCGGKTATEKAEKPVAKTPLTVHYGYQPGHVQIVVAREMGWLKEEFEKDEITFELEKFASGPAMNEAFAGNRIDFGQVGDQPAIQLKSNNVDVKAIGVYSNGTKITGLIAANGANINSPADLKGKKVGFVVGSVSHQLLYIYLKSAGLKPNDIQQVNLASSDILSSIASNHIDAAVIWEPTLSNVVASGAGKLVTDATGYKENINVIVGRSEFLSKYPDITVRLLKVLDRAEKWIKANPDKALEIIAKNSGFKPEVLRPGFENVIFDLRLTDEAVKSIAETAVFLKENKLIRNDVNVKDFVDDQYLKAAGIQ
ncbi:ABC transporter substrate-binding protein [Sporomusa sp. KB1]|jgi:sulfonate transport system substrate-binding protein|uniref:ABC transporter substrate-binding protein n=1 Tax=Sporomusa sp. KB1 TaxID=943346 RepID=UPI0011A02BB3|nr:aliphatic sulfonate ABC transporter substrate-binding protein [Sporomusa sp. KB1]TWH51880.1 sulfonate transport system substrate-binding protein [Sporomusa sp. KB1]